MAVCFLVDGRLLQALTAVDYLAFLALLFALGDLAIYDNPSRLVDVPSKLPLLQFIFQLRIAKETGQFDCHE